ncbi:MAG: hypothetical protein ACI4SB_03815 [Acutalibacteraceae bacterium]
MAADMINTVLKAEAEARKQIEAAKNQADEIIKNAKQKADEIKVVTLKQAENEAVLILSESELSTEGTLSQAEKLAKLRERKVISETEKHYDECIKLILDNLV